jgi:hypothetical protein
VPQHQIAEELGISRQQVGYDLGLIRAEWQASAARDFDQHVAEELAKLDHLEATYWDGWQRSLQPLESTSSEEIADEVCMPAGRRHQRVKVPRSRTRAATRTEQQHGDASFLAGVARCIEQRCRVLGLNAPASVNVAGSLDFGALYELAQQGQARPRLEVLEGAKPVDDHHANGHHRADALLPDGDHPKVQSLAGPGPRRGSDGRFAGRPVGRRWNAWRSRTSIHRSRPSLRAGSRSSAMYCWMRRRETPRRLAASTVVIRYSFMAVVLPLNAFEDAALPACRGRDALAGMIGIGFGLKG